MAVTPVSATVAALAIGFLIPHGHMQGQQAPRPRARDAGVIIGVFQPGPLNAITDVDGVRVGHTTVNLGDTIHTGVTAILPHGGNIFQERVPAALFVLNGFGKLVGVTQLQEHGELETPILLTCTLCVWKAADAMTAYLLDEDCPPKNCAQVDESCRHQPEGLADRFEVAGR